MDIILVLKDLTCKDMVIEIMKYYEYGKYKALCIENGNLIYAELIPNLLDNAKINYTNCIKYIIKLIEKDDVDKLLEVVYYNDKIIVMKHRLENEEIDFKLYTYKEILNHTFIENTIFGSGYSVDILDINYSSAEYLTNIIYSLNNIIPNETLLIRNIVTYYCKFKQCYKETLWLVGLDVGVKYIEVFKNTVHFGNFSKFIEIKHKQYREQNRKLKYNLSKCDDNGILVNDGNTIKYYTFNDIIDNDMYMEKIRADFVEKTSLIYKLTGIDGFIGITKSMELIPNFDLYDF